MATKRIMISESKKFDTNDWKYFQLLYPDAYMMIIEFTDIFEHCRMGVLNKYWKEFITRSRCTKIHGTVIIDLTRYIGQLHLLYSRIKSFNFIKLNIKYSKTKLDTSELIGVYNSVIIQSCAGLRELVLDDFGILENKSVVNRLSSTLNHLEVRWKHSYYYHMGIIDKLITLTSLSLIATGDHTFMTHYPAIEFPWFSITKLNLESTDYELYRYALSKSKYVKQLKINYCDMNGIGRCEEIIRYINDLPMLEELDLELPALPSMAFIRNTGTHLGLNKPLVLRKLTMTNPGLFRAPRFHGILEFKNLTELTIGHDDNSYEMVIYSELINQNMPYLKNGIRFSIDRVHEHVDVFGKMIASVSSSTYPASCDIIKWIHVTEEKGMKQLTSLLTFIQYPDVYISDFRFCFFQYHQTMNDRDLIPHELCDIMHTNNIDNGCICGGKQYICDELSKGYVRHIVERNIIPF